MRENILLVILIASLVLIFLKQDKKPVEKKINFSEVYVIQNQTYNNDGNGFILSTDIVNVTKDRLYKSKY